MLRQMMVARPPPRITPCFPFDSQVASAFFERYSKARAAMPGGRRKPLVIGITGGSELHLCCVWTHRYDVAPFVLSTHSLPSIKSSFTLPPKKPI